MPETKVFYASPNGLTTATGSKEDPLDLVTALADSKEWLDDGPVLISLLPGVYRTKVHVADIGNDRNRLIVEPESPHTAVFQALGSNDQYEGTFQLSGLENTVFRNLRFRQAPIPQRGGTNHFKIISSSNIRLVGCDWSDLQISQGAVQVINGSKNITVHNCKFENLRWNDDDPPPNRGNHMVYIAETGTENVQLLSCSFTDNFGGSYVKAKNESSSVSIADCVFSRSKHVPKEGMSGAFIHTDRDSGKGRVKSLSTWNNTFVNMTNYSVRGHYLQTAPLQYQGVGNHATGDVDPESVNPGNS